MGHLGPAFSRMVEASPALAARERQIHDQREQALAEVLVAQATPAEELTARVVAAQIAGVYRVVYFTGRRLLLEGLRARRSPRRSAPPRCVPSRSSKPISAASTRGRRLRSTRMTEAPAEDAGRIVFLATSPRVALGLLSWPAWETLRAADVVFAGDAEHPHIPYVEQATGAVVALPGSQPVDGRRAPPGGRHAGPHRRLARRGRGVRRGAGGGAREPPGADAGRRRCPSSRCCPAPTTCPARGCWTSWTS